MCLAQIRFAGGEDLRSFEKSQVTRESGAASLGQIQVMQKKAIIFIVIAILALATISVVQTRKAAELKAQAAAGLKKAEADSKDLEGQQITIERLQKQKTLLNKKLHELAERAETGATGPSNSPIPISVETEPGLKASEGKGGFFAKMLADPEMKKMVREQQKLMMSQMYGPLFESLKLTPEENEKLTSLMLENQMNSVEKGTALLNPETDKAALQKNLADDKKQFDDEVKNLLGAERFGQYQEFNQSLPDRMALTQLKSQFGDDPLSESQSAQLLNAMKEERLRSATDGKAIPESDFASMLSEETMNKYFSEQEGINQRIVERAAGVLTPKQVEVLGRSLANNLAMQRTGMNMARTMLNGEKDSGSETGKPAK